jgi:serine protease Do
MNQNRRPVGVRVLALLLAAAIPISVFTLQPAWLAQLTYAVEAGQARVAQEQLAVANDLSEAFRDVAKAMRPSVVSISSTRRMEPRMNPENRIPNELRGFLDEDIFERFFEFQIPESGLAQRGLGSGVIVSEDGYVLTNNHVVGDADDVDVTLSDGRQFRAETVGADKATDIAVLKIDASDLVPAKLGKSAALEVGEWVLAMGSPFGLDHTVTAGIISATGRANMGITDYEDFIQTDAAINPGNSGGPLVNLHGEVIGINTAIASRTQGYMGVGFAIPSEMAGHVMRGIIDKGFVTRGWLGAAIRDLSEALAESFEYDSTDGVLIDDVVAESPADKAGLKAGDIVTSFNGQTVESANELRNAVAATAPGSEVNLDIVRRGERKTLTVNVAQLNEDKLAAATGGRESSNNLGMTVEDLTPSRASQLGINDVQGVVVTEIESNGMAAPSLKPPHARAAATGQELILRTMSLHHLLRSEQSYGNHDANKVGSGKAAQAAAPHAASKSLQ